MTGAVPDILARIVEHKTIEVSRLGAKRAELEAASEQTLARRRDFRGALFLKTPAVIAEIKKASPSRGVLSRDFEPAKIAGRYFEGGAAALSVLTDERYFQGSMDDLRAARASSPLPVLRKDFVVDEIQLHEAAAGGADAVLLIAAVLPSALLRRLCETASRLRLAALVEVHDADELASALDAGADLVGVNNRNLRTFEVTLETSLELAARMPPGVVRVSESGIHSRADVQRLRQAGFQAFLVGEHLMTAPDPAAALRELSS